MFGFRSRRFASRLLVGVVVGLVLVLYVMIYSENSLGSNEVAKSKHISSQYSPTKPDLVVIEEHHEVLEYWFGAAEKGIIPRSGNILVHIDAHSDMAPPEIVDDFPTFRWPMNKKEVGAMMQSNDVFIQAALMSGLFKKVVWVWPSWDEDNHETDDLNRYFGGGWTTVTIGGKPEKTLCECEIKKDGVTKTACQYVNRTAYSEDDDYDGSRIDPEKCTILGKIEYQEIVGYNALNKIMTGELVKDDESLLLDIDEDFFGCVLRGQDLVNAGIAWNEVEEINEILNELFCPQIVEHEAMGNNLMQVILTLIKTKCQKSNKVSKACITPGNPINEAFKSSLNKIIKPFTTRGILCRMENKKREKKLSLLIEFFIQMDLKQLEAFSNIGFCMQTSPRSYNSPGFNVCHGANEPNATVVTVHMPGENEIKLRLRRLRRLIQAKSYPTPKMVTLCRSVRDGYTPVPYFSVIEKHIIESIRTSRPGVDFNVIYDRNLLGGINGWPSRQKNKPLRKKRRNTRRKNIFNINA